jgi:hypothetical protein
MAGLSGKQNIIDVVAASERLRPSVTPELPTQPPVSLEVAAAAPTDVAADHAAEEMIRCAFGHPAPAGYRFCPDCGIPMGAALPTSGEPMRPRPAAELTPAERAERDRQHAAAVAAAAQFEQAQPAYVPTEGAAVLIHFIADGLTAFGQVWYRGQELEIGPDHPRWEEARGWIMLDRWAQIERWREQKFDFGPWPGRRSYAEAAGSFEQLTVTDPQGNKALFAGPSEEQLRQADDAERRRGRAVPAAVFG